MTEHRSPHLRAVFQALLVTFLWSISIIMVKIGLKKFQPFGLPINLLSSLAECILIYGLKPWRK